ncbi:MAG: hypothetical protein GY722_12910 [bacterium]|nr:hypothetical protein [bacterium]
MVDRLFRWLLAERKPSILYALAAGAGLAMAWYLLGWEGIHGTGHHWETTHNDSLQGIAALRYYMSEPWSWSVLEVAGYGFPEGTSLILSDSIPLLAVPAKVLRGLLPDTFHYFGYWMAFCFMMQATVLVALLVELRWRNYAAVVAGSVLGLTQTVLLARFFHVAMLAQFSLVIVLILGIRLIRGGEPRRFLVALSVLLLATFFVHLYLFAMVFALAVAVVVQGGLARRLAWTAVGGWTAAALVATAVLVVSTGLSGAASSGIGGLGHYSANFLAPVVGNIDATGGQYEGYSYMGLGVIIPGLGALVLARRRIAAVLRQFWVPVVVAVLMAIYALSPTVWIGESVSFDIPWFWPLDWLGERFRSTGRFIWPLVYLSIAATLYMVVRNASPRVAATVLLVAALIQAVDMAPLVENVEEILEAGDEQLLPPDLWSDVIASHQLVRISPQQCVVELGDVSLANREVQRIAALAGVPVTAAAVARTTGDCNDPAFEQPVAVGELRIVWSAVDPDYQIDGAHCVGFSLGTACSASAGGRGIGLLQPISDFGT